MEVEKGKCVSSPWMKMRKIPKLRNIIISYLISLLLVVGTVYGSRILLYYNTYRDKTLFAGDCIPMVLKNMNNEKFDYAGIFGANEGTTLVLLQSRRYFPYKNIVFIADSLKRVNRTKDKGDYEIKIRYELAKMFPFSKIIIPSSGLLHECYERHSHPRKKNHLTEEGHIWLTRQKPFENTGILEDIVEGKKEGLNKKLVQD